MSTKRGREKEAKWVGDHLEGGRGEGLNWLLGTGTGRSHHRKGSLTVKKCRKGGPSSFLKPKTGKNVRKKRGKKHSPYEELKRSPGGGGKMHGGGKLHTIS